MDRTCVNFLPLTIGEEKEASPEHLVGRVFGDVLSGFRVSSDAGNGCQILFFQDMDDNCDILSWEIDLFGRWHTATGVVYPEYVPHIVNNTALNFKQGNDIWMAKIHNVVLLKRILFGGHSERDVWRIFPDTKEILSFAPYLLDTDGLE